MPAPRPPSVASLSAAAQANGAKLQAVADDPLGSLFAPKQIPASAMASGAHTQRTTHEFCPRFVCVRRCFVLLPCACLFLLAGFVS